MPRCSSIRSRSTPSTSRASPATRPSLHRALLLPAVLAAALILAQSVLLGATVPLMTGGVLPLRPERAGDVVAMLYFTNSLGAAACVLASGFCYIAAVGLPGTLVAAGVVNLAAALA